MANTSLVKAFAFLFISGAGVMWSMDGNCCSTGTLEDSMEVCCFNFYKNGSVCKACPAGYYGTNCNEICPQSLYGLECKQSCDCTSCHHIYGCITSTETETLSYENNAEYNNSTQIQKSRNNIGRILIISAGTVISLTLMLIILHEFVTFWQIHDQGGVHQVVHDVYDDIDAVERVL